MLIALLIYVVEISFSTVLTEKNDVPEYVPCERGWYYWGEKCYKGGSQKEHQRVTWNTALEKCRRYGGDLVSIGSQEEQDFITTFLLLDLKAMTFIGLNDISKEEDYKWSDGTVFNYTNWVPTQPVPGATESEDCVHMWFDPGNDLLGKWNDINCQDRQRYICEMKSNPSKRSRNPIYCSTENGRGWKWQDSCYHIVTKKETWQNAEKHCKMYYNGHLATALNMLEDEFLGYILGNMKEEVWIGIKVQEQLQQKWSSGWYVSYDGFKRNMHFREGTCAARKKRKEWITAPCTNTLPFICKTSRESPPVLKPPLKGSHCPIQFDGWRDLGGQYCYYFETEKAVNFYEALFDCKRRGGNMVSLHSKEEEGAILPFITYSEIGKRISHEHDWAKFMSSRVFWIGLVRAWPRDEEFVWTDGSAVDYVNWLANQPDDEREKCVEVHTHDIGYLYQWNDIRCEEKRGYICSVKKILTNPLLTEEDDCDSFCISQESYLYEIVQQSSDAKLLPKGDITNVN